MKHILPTDLVNKILTYLAGKAYSEVSALINEIKTKAELHIEAEQSVSPTIEPSAIESEKP